MVRESLRLVLGIETNEKPGSGLKPLSVSLVETRGAIKDYFLKLLQGRVWYWGRLPMQSLKESRSLLGTRLVEESLLQLYRSGAGPSVLKGRLDYLIRYKALPLGQQVEQAIVSGVT